MQEEAVVAIGPQKVFINRVAFARSLPRPRSSCHKLPHLTPFRCDQAKTIITDPPPQRLDL